MEKESLRDVVRTFEPGAAPPGLPEWTSITTPGHSPGHTAFFRRGSRVLISGDALLTVDAGSLGGVLSWVLRPNKPRVCEPPWYTNWDRDQMMASVDAVIRLQPRVLASGHGRPLSGAAAASELRPCMFTHGLMQAGLETRSQRANDHTCSSGLSRAGWWRGLAVCDTCPRFMSGCGMLRAYDAI